MSDGQAAPQPKPIPTDGRADLLARVAKAVGMTEGQLVRASICLTEAWPPGEYGDRAILVAENADCEECGKKHDMEKCPKCGSWIHVGFGLYRGGYGDYKVCLAECGWFWRRILEDDEA